MAPVVKEFQKYPDEFETKVCVTAQHREMLDQVLGFFEIKPDYDLDIMKQDQDLSSLTSSLIESLTNVFEDFKPNYVYVHGDTTTTFSASLSAFYFGAKVCHVEAGLRTYDKKAPFPEEVNRQLTGRLTDIHFAPTERAKENLLKENIKSENILVTGNTVIDALRICLSKLESYSSDELEQVKSIVDPRKKLILVTGHRRENFGEGMIQICEALKEIAIRKDVQIIYPVHLNPNVQKPVYELLSNLDNVDLIEPLSYESFVWLMNESYLIITDSGGIQEEAPFLGKPVLLMREVSERPEALGFSTVLVGSNRDKILANTNLLISDVQKYNELSSARNLYGKGTASRQIVEYQKKVKI
ncbi:MAG: UDP-N-acetylglucosamine 2-epimerase (non-hydrolyzing) [Balneolaceae bacterium]|nr:UDP-N-acetylglucosamine 2-epimerase (non-hydrolyzing) [Balneolaceae bacterium]MBO6545300.1 UDP-N-acetylglucosamine 2-epimerase (non-hydrolyzing) [Balneolaceae bacterium]MBO6646696.1 UDP-N-acetylglucosamine 2-epimerase (non-hydrolyzing) [Balneolaceae bacterium]